LDLAEIKMEIGRRLEWRLDKGCGLSRVGEPGVADENPTRKTRND
jgi:hypothetical protein